MLRLVLGLSGGDRDLAVGGALGAGHLDDHVGPEQPGTELRLHLEVDLQGLRGEGSYPLALGLEQRHNGMGGEMSFEYLPDQNWKSYSFVMQTLEKLGALYLRPLLLRPPPGGPKIKKKPGPPTDSPHDISS